MPFHAIITLILAVVLIVGVFAIILWLLRFDEEDLDFLKSLKLLKNKAIEPIKRK